MTARSGRHSFVRDYGPMVLFALTTIGGMIFIWSAKLAGWSIGVVTAVPLILMAIYFLASILFGGFRLHNEQAGDNLYYMGFLFTLSSLGVSLYLFAGDTSIDTIVRNFGIAVTSTIAGVTLRILFNQMRRDPIDIERSTRHELAEMTRRVRSELDSSSREFANYRRVSNQMLAEGFEEIARQAEKNGEEIRKAIETLSHEAIAPIQDAARKMSAMLDTHNTAVTAQTTAATARLSETADRLASIIEGFGGVVEGVGDKLGALKLPEQSVLVQLPQVIASVKEVTETHLQQVEAGRATTLRWAEKVEDALKPIAGVEAKLDRLVNALEQGGGIGGQPSMARAVVGDAASADDKFDAAPGSAAAGDVDGTKSPDDGGEHDEGKRRWFGWQRP